MNWGRLRLYSQENGWKNMIKSVEDVTSKRSSKNMRLNEVTTSTRVAMKTRESRVETCESD